MAVSAESMMLKGDLTCDDCMKEVQYVWEVTATGPDVPPQIFQFCWKCAVTMHLVPDVEEYPYNRIEMNLI